MTYTITEEIVLETITCGECGLMFAVPRRWKQERQDEGGTFYCPNGHPRVFCEPEVQRLQRQLAAKQRENERLERARESLRFQRDHAERSASAYKGQVTKIKNRVHAGVCPHCNRTFQQLARHMKSQHLEQLQQAEEAKK